MVERTLLLIKPDACRRGLVGEVLRRYEGKGLRIVAMDLRTVDGAVADRQYADHLEKDLYPALRAFITGGPLVAVVLEGDGAVEVVRTLNGATDAPRPCPARFAAASPCRAEKC